MSLIKKIVLGYLLIASVVFFAGYVVLGIREMGLYLFLVFMNLPGSLIVEPAMERLSESLGWILGGPVHILTPQLVCMVTNGALLITTVALTSKLRQSFRGGRDTTKTK